MTGVPLLQVGDVELYYESRGSGDPLVLAAIPGARLALLSGGHLISLMPHRQAQFVATVREFLPPGR
jgi:hypothetical protein